MKNQIKNHIKGLTKALKYVIIRHMQKKNNYFLFIVQGRGLYQRLELDSLGVVPRFVTSQVMNHTLDREKLVVAV
tara:strand:+ start:193 stop:417 length:225 start_codon:yes stop_codon:yes gene_type:complete